MKKVTCPSCKKDITMPTFMLLSSIECQHCKKSFYFTKKMFFMLVEMLIQVAILFTVYELLYVVAGLPLVLVGVLVLGLSLVLMNVFTWICVKLSKKNKLYKLDSRIIK